MEPRPPPIDPVIHEASRLTIVSALNECDACDFNLLLATTGLTRGNLSTHLTRLVGAGYVHEKKSFVARRPHSEYKLTQAGRAAYERYIKAWRRLTGIG